ncbi:MAG: T9SS type A sorting domain-containing protein [Bacteroidales bacterium]
MKVNRMKTLLMLLAGLMLSAFDSEAQKEANIWYFGENAGLDFSGGTPAYLLNGVMNKDEGCSSVSDANGNLLFYTSGIRVWNRNHQQMPNGSGLAGHESSSQSALIVPRPGSTNLFYVFTTDAFFYSNGLRYSVVDLSLQGGMGDVTTKNVLLHTPSTEKLTAVKHSNQTDIWVIAHEGNSSSFTAYLVTSAGVSPPVTTSIGMIHTGGGATGTLNAIGCMKASPDGSKLALAMYNQGSIELFDFNSTSGAFSNPVSFPAIYPWAYGVEFSPDNSKLYFTTDSIVYQADLNAGSPTAIINSVLPVGSVALGPFGEGYLAALQLGPDMKIYGTSFFSEYLVVINAPDARGIECGFDEQGVWLGGRHCYAGLPGFVQSWFYNPPSAVDKPCKNDDGVSVYPNPSTGQIRVVCPEETWSVEVINLYGQIVTKVVPGDSQQVTITGLRSGCYCINVHSRAGIVSKKVLIR